MHTATGVDAEVKIAQEDKFWGPLEDALDQGDGMP
jgi:hypothetical protein